MSGRRSCLKKVSRGKGSPKRLSGYMCFLKAVLREFKKQHPTTPIVLSEVSTMCAEQWKNIPEVVKNRFQEEAENANRTKFGQQIGQEINTKVNVKVKRPCSAFILFSKDYRRIIKAGYPNLTMGEISTVLSSMWSKGDKETKLKYQQLSRMERERYHKLQPPKSGKQNGKGQHSEVKSTVNEPDVAPIPEN